MVGTQGKRSQETPYHPAGLTVVSEKREKEMNRKLIISGMILLALVLTSGTFAYTYSGFSMNTLDSAAATETFTTHEPSADQPDWDDVLP